MSACRLLLLVGIATTAACHPPQEGRIAAQSAAPEQNAADATAQASNNESQPMPDPTKAPAPPPKPTSPPPVVNPSPVQPPAEVDPVRPDVGNETPG